MKTITLVLALAAALAFPATANAADESTDHYPNDDQFDCEMAEGEWIPQDPKSGLTICVYPDGGVLICDDIDCEEVPPRVVNNDQRIPVPTTTGTVMTPATPAAPANTAPATIYRPMPMPTTTGTVMTPTAPAAPATTGVMVPTTNGVMVPATTGYQVR